MKHIDKNTLLSIIIAGMALATAWAIRGQFGHEQGAAWAGGIGALSILLLAKREDWYNKAIKAAFAGAVGWGFGGMMSYGILVGYGRGEDFINVYYGLASLFVVGGLYGLIGGGLFGLVLADNPEKKIKWHQVVTEMTVGGIIFYYFMVEQLGFEMTPPRSEAWGICAGTGIAMLYYMARTQQYSAMRVAIYAGLGGGFGFAFGNFLHVLGNVANVPFNMWNVMEYSLGFFGGVGMAYGTFTSKWPKEETPYQFTTSNLIIPGVGLLFLIPFFVWQQSFIMKDFSDTLGAFVSQPDAWMLAVQLIALLVFLGLAIFWINLFSTKKRLDNQQFGYQEISKVFITYFGTYILFTIFITGSFLSFYRIEQFLYILNYIIILAFIPKFKPSFSERAAVTKTWRNVFLIIMVILAILTLILINSHGELSHAHKRFEWI
ncbi:hypothetical protein [Cyclobacterium marinum]|uniref:Uncharacterized protein n=1 Tax=Cyclobacterium marinum (strain ATCC 25205 / DSM 745 / LMG 13164 / NCIMB 1802) TaxID=880070 RepID=G0J154_CYCMS|nr:hypothetical protein [Cyclobacterium marinum]AEL25803.1 hypothetical protein Cycma_2056 [Cyclobacterium marinum DSM 745]